MSFKIQKQIMHFEQPNLVLMSPLARALHFAYESGNHVPTLWYEDFFMDGFKIDRVFKIYGTDSWTSTPHGCLYVGTAINYVMNSGACHLYEEI